MYINPSRKKKRIFFSCLERPLLTNPKLTVHLALEYFP